MKKLLKKLKSFPADKKEDAVPPLEGAASSVLNTELNQESEASEATLIMRDVYEDPHNPRRIIIELRDDGLSLQQGEIIREIDIEQEEEYRQIEEEVRCHLARKISLLAPMLAKEDKQYLLHYTVKVLKCLAHDQEERVRRIIAEELKDKIAAPPEIIRDLAWDIAEPVAAPVLEYSPLLSDGELIEILASSNLPWIEEAVAKRRYLSPEVSDAITATENEEAILQLLRNEKAELSEEGLERIVDEAIEIESWHEPLTYRPELTLNTINRIAGFISLSLFRRLESEQRLPPEVLYPLKHSVNERLRDIGLDRERSAEITVTDLYRQGLLGPETVRQAMEEGNEPMVAHALALLCRFSVDKTRKILGSASAKAVTALAWQAGLTMRDAIQLQLRFGKVHHSKALYAKAGSEFPLETNEMREFLDFFS